MQLNVRNISFSYKKNIPVVQNLSFEVNSGDLVAILGPNGAGKTTLLKCIMGFLKLSDGQCLLDGDEINKIPSRRLWNKISYVPQAKSTSSSLSAEEMILLGLTSKIGIFSVPTTKDRNKIRDLAKKLGIENLLCKKCNEISGGELQMVLIARALAADPELLILDEPESNLDFRNQLIVLDTLSALAASGIAVIFNTHYPEHALTRANKSLIIRKNGSSIFGDTTKVVTEENIKSAFGVSAVIRDIETAGNIYKSILPLHISNLDEKDNTSQNRSSIGVLSIIFSNYSYGTRINEILSRYGKYVIGRMGMPYSSGGVYIVNVTLDAPISEIESLQQELTIFTGVNVKATISEKYDNKQGDLYDCFISY